MARNTRKYVIEKRAIIRSRLKLGYLTADYEGNLPHKIGNVKPPLTIVAVGGQIAKAYTEQPPTVSV